MPRGYPPRWCGPSDRERVAARALVRGPRVLDLQAPTEQRRVELERRPVDDRRAARVDHHPNTLHAGDDVIVRGHGLVEAELVGEARASAGDDPQAQDRLGAALLRGELRDLARGGVREGPRRGRGAHGLQDSRTRDGSRCAVRQPPRNEAKMRAYVRAPVTISSTSIHSSAVWATERSPGPKMTVGIAASFR